MTTPVACHIFRIYNYFVYPPPQKKKNKYKRLGIEVEGLPGLLSVGKDSHPLRSGSLSIHNTNLPFYIFVPPVCMSYRLSELSLIIDYTAHTLWQKSDLLIFVDLYYI